MGALVWPRSNLGVENGHPGGLLLPENKRTVPRKGPPLLPLVSLPWVFLGEDLMRGTVADSFQYRVHPDAGRESMKGILWDVTQLW